MRQESLHVRELRNSGPAHFQLLQGENEAPTLGKSLSRTPHAVVLANCEGVHKH